MNRLELHPALVCPECHGALADDPDLGGRVRCGSCSATYPVTGGGVPVLLPSDSAFDPDTIAGGTDTYYANRVTESRKIRGWRKRLPGLASDLQHRETDTLVNRLLAKASPEAEVDGLVVGAGFRVEEYAARFPRVRWLITDTEATFGAGVVGDVTRLPVADATMDFVLCEHVLEHVLDPLAAAREIERVLRPGGVALVKVPFNFPWHGGYIDFFRFTPAGYLAAFRRLEAIHIGHGPGPATTISYAMNDAFISLFTRRSAKRAAVAIGRIALAPWRHLDRVLVRRPGSLGISCTMNFVGRRWDHERTSREVIAEAKALGKAPVLAPSQRPEWNA